MCKLCISHVIVLNYFNRYKLAASLYVPYKVNTFKIIQCILHWDNIIHRKLYELIQKIGNKLVLPINCDTILSVANIMWLTTVPYYCKLFKVEMFCSFCRLIGNCESFVQWNNWYYHARLPYSHVNATVFCELHLSSTNVKLLDLEQFEICIWYKQ